MKNKLISVEEVAEILQVSTTTVYRLLEQGRIKATRLTSRGQYRIRHEDVEEFLKKEEFNS